MSRGRYEPISLGPGQWVDPPRPRRPKPSLTERVVKAIGKGRGLAEVAAEVGRADAGLDLTDETIEVLCDRLSREIEERQQLSAALGGVLERRRVGS